ncbi:MAG: hypothetical protein HYX68_14240 [Planctomycetes bacterium]|nr:hypothetical protein [Planctomycetota bacterium]
MKKPFAAAVTFFTFLAIATAQDLAQPIGSYLYEPAYCVDNILRGKARAYIPQPGDVLLATDKNLFWKITHDWALAFEPHNSAIVVSRRDGRLAILEAGPNDTFWVRVLDLLPHLKEYADKGPVWIRKRKTPLTAEQMACLTDFAERQNGKRFALGRLGAQLTPLRSRGPFRTAVLGKPRGDRRAYFCSELVTEAGVAAGLLDARTTRPAATYPHDLFFDQSHNRYINRHLPLVHDWEPPARWLDYDVNAEK